jgi:hypothetical protein
MPMGTGVDTLADAGAVAGEGDAARSWPVFALGILAATFVPMILMPASVAAPSVRSFVIVAGFLNFVGGTAHVGASGYFYLEPEFRSHMTAHLRRYLWAPLGLAVFLGLGCQYGSPAFRATVLLLYFAWQTYHYQRQNYGILAFAAARNRQPGPTLAETVALELAVFSGIFALFAIMNLHVGTVLEPFIYEITYAARALAWAALLAAAFALLRHRDLLRAPERMAAMAIGALFFMPSMLFSKQAAAVSSYALAHGLQ